jgi:hypothetical protein
VTVLRLRVGALRLRRTSVAVRVMWWARCKSDGAICVGGLPRRSAVRLALPAPASLIDEAQPPRF